MALYKLVCTHNTESVPTCVGYLLKKIERKWGQFAVFEKDTNTALLSIQDYIDYASGFESFRGVRIGTSIRNRQLDVYDRTALRTIAQISYKLLNA